MVKCESKMKRLRGEFFGQDVLVVAPRLLGKVLVCRMNDGGWFRDEIVEVEAYRGEEDLVCHARVGRTA